MPIARPLPPVWLMGLANLPWGVYGAITLITVPQLLAARGVPETEIASVTAFAMVPAFGCFLLSPILDVRFSRRAYALAFVLLTALLAFAALLSIGDLPRLSILLFLGYTCAALFNGAIGGWLGSSVAAGGESRLGAWFAIANISGFGIAAVLAIALLRQLPHALGAAATSLLILAPALILVWMPEPGAERRLARESFAKLFADLRALIKSRVVLRTLLLFCLPASSFALTNTLGGLGRDFHISERLVSIVAGVGVTIAGVVGSLAAPLFADRAPRLLYLLIGGLGAVFTLSLLLLPREPWVFALALIGENVFQAAAFSVENTIIFRGLGKDNPLAATQFTFLNAATAMPITYMQAVDGQAYGHGGLTATLATDAGISLAACALLLPLVLRWQRREAPAMLQHP